LSALSLYTYNAEIFCGIIG